MRKFWGYTSESIIVQRVPMNRKFGKPWLRWYSIAVVPNPWVATQSWVAVKFFWVACFSNFSACFSFSFAKNLQKIKFNFYSSLLIYEYTANQTKHQFSSVQFSFISAPPHEQNNKMLRSLCVVKDGVRKRKKQQNELML